MRKLTFRLLVALLTFTFGITVVSLWFVYHSQSVKKIEKPKVIFSAAPKAKVSMPDEWRKIDVEGIYTFYLPEGMKPSELTGDSDYRKAFSNGKIRIIFGYVDGNSACDTPAHLLERATYQESTLEVDGEKGKLGIDRFYAPKIITYLCFPNTRNSKTRIWINAVCSDERALETVRQIYGTVEFAR